MLYIMYITQYSNVLPINGANEGHVPGGSITVNRSQ